MIGLQIIKKPYVATAIVYSAAAVAFLLQMGGLKLHSLLVPVICVGIMIICACVTIIFRDQEEKELSTNAKEIITLAATIVYAGLIYLFGFYAASVVFSLFIFLHVSGWTIRFSVIGLLNSVGNVLVVYVLFNLFLDYFIPQGVIMENFF